MIVMKFGGSSVGTPEALAQVVGLVERFRDAKPVLVVSALQGVTDALLALAAAATDGRTVTVTAGIASLRERHHAMVSACVNEGAEACLGGVDALIGELASALSGMNGTRARIERAFDEIVSFGERLSTPIVAAAIASRGIPASSVDARGLIVTDDRFGSANVSFAQTDERVAAVILPMVEAGTVPVVTGFIGATAEGATTTLGRGGSDYSVAIVAAAIGADEIWIWKEVDGVLTADPRIVPEASLLSAISYDEAAELAHFGAKVLHPKSMIPAVDRKIPVRMRNTFRPDAPGTIIGERSVQTQSGVKAVAAVKKLSMVTVEGRGMSGMAGFAAHVFGVAGRHGINIVMFCQSSSEQNICLISDAKDGRRFKEALERELAGEVSQRLVDTISVCEDVAAVAVVGEGMRGVPGVAARLFRAVASVGVNVLAIAQGSSERCVSFIIAESSADDIVRAVHASFALHAPFVEKTASSYAHAGAAGEKAPAWSDDKNA